MSDSARPKLFVNLDQHAAEGWHTITVVTPKEFIAARISPISKGQTVIGSLYAGGDPVELLKKNSPMLQGPSIVPLESADSIEWHADDAALYVRYFDDKKKKLRVAGAEMSSADARTQMIDCIEQLVGTSERLEVPSSIWHVGTTSIILSVFATMFFVIPGVVGLFTEALKPENMSRALARMLGQLMNAIAPVGMILLGLSIIAGLMFWWFLRCTNPPLKHVAKLLRT
jgi:hypothetical protein